VKLKKEVGSKAENQKYLILCFRGKNLPNPFIPNEMPLWYSHSATHVESCAPNPKRPKMSRKGIDNRLLSYQFRFVNGDNAYDYTRKALTRMDMFKRSLLSAQREKQKSITITLYLGAALDEMYETSDTC
jgi:hypothetical protein